MKLEDVMRALDYKVNDTCEYLWKSFGPNARHMDFKMDHAYVAIVFDTQTQVIYNAVVEATNIAAINDRPYRWMNPTYVDAVNDEAQARGIDYAKAWDDVFWIDLDLSADFLEKAVAIANNLPYDKRVLIPINLPEDRLLELALLAHRRDITLNALIIEIILSEIRNHDTK